MENHFKTNYKISINAEVKTSQLMKLFEDGLKDILWTEKTLIKEIPLFIKKSTSVELIEVLMHHLKETNGQIDRLALIFRSIDRKAVANKCEPMESLLKETGKIIEFCEAGAMRDSGIIASFQKIEHYEIATYSTLYHFAEILRLNDAAELLHLTLDEEKATNKKLSRLATRSIYVAASEELIEN